MKINTMRAIDRYAGIPLCFISTLVNKIFFRPKKGVTPKNILFIELSEMGSAILADPAMRKAKDTYSGELFFLIFQKNKPSLDLLGTVDDDNIFTIRPEMKHIVQDTLRFYQWSRKKKIDTVIDIELFSRYTALLSGFCGADNRVGFHRFYNEGLYRGGMLTHKIAYNPNQHIAKNFIAMINALGESPDTYPLSKSLVKDEDVVLVKAEIKQKDRDKITAALDTVSPKDWRERCPRIVLVNPNASDLLPQRRWPVEHFIDFIKIILDKYDDVLVVLTGAGGESPLAERIRTAVDVDRCVNFTGKAKLKEMLALYDISDVMLTNDSGPGHFSAVTDLHTFVIFGPETPALYGSLGNSTPLFLGLSCSPCVTAANHRKTTCNDSLCVKNILPQYVADLVIKSMDR